ncbi:hypothetical protein [Pseudochrobactrum sp. MP213Fo]|uniref:hypothetical protein n=1 Tax=Pseudochrobactrum sp. MP213Fo TaxID=3022250 RepID=UPI003BA24BEC
MSISYPLNLLDSFPGWSTEFDLFYRQEFSRTAGGSTIVKNLGTPLWQASFQSTVMLPNVLDTWRARMKALEGGMQPFMGRSMSRCFPIAYPNGAGLGNVKAIKIDSVGVDNKSLTLINVPVWHVVSVGDYVQIGPRLYQVIEEAVSNAAGRTTRFEVRPHLAPGTAEGNIVTLVKPSVAMIIVPGSLSTATQAITGRGSITFHAIESR